MTLYYAKYIVPPDNGFSLTSAYRVDGFDHVITMQITKPVTI